MWRTGYGGENMKDKVVNRRYGEGGIEMWKQRNGGPGMENQV